MTAAVLVGTASGSASAAPANYYGENARAVAKDLGCNAGTFKADNQPKLWLSGGGCRVAGNKVGFATFEGAGRQGSYVDFLTRYVKHSFPRGTYYFAQDKGVVVVGRNLGKGPASLAKRRLGATIQTIQVK